MHKEKHYIMNLNFFELTQIFLYLTSIIKQNHPSQGKFYTIEEIFKKN